MDLPRTIRRGVRALLRRRREDRDVADEVGHFLEEAAADLVASGATEDEARRAVRLHWGDGLAAREDVRASGWESGLETLASDVRLGVRSLRRSPGFTTVVVLTLGIGVGAATAIFSAVRPVLFESLPYPHPERLLSVTLRGGDGSPTPAAFRSFLEVEARSRAFQGLTVFKPWQPTLTGGEEPVRLEGQAVSAGFFPVLGVVPTLGPGFEPGDDRPGGLRTAVVSDGFWRRRLGGDADAVGAPLRLDGETYTVVGVLPPGFVDVVAPSSEVWTLLRYDPLTTDFDTREWGHHLGMLARMRPGVEVDGARRALDGVAREPVPDFPRPAWAAMSRGFEVRPLRDAVTADARPTSLVFLGAVALLLAVTCANLTLLLLARGARRRGEFAMRVALGARGGRLARYLVTESLLLAAAGGVVGVAVGWGALAVLVARAPATLPGAGAAALDGPALAFALGVTTLVGVVFGLAPGLHRTSARPGELRAGGRGVPRGGGKARRALVVAEVAMAAVLLVGTGLVLRSVRGLAALPPGFDPSGVAVVRVYGTGLERGDAATHRFFDAALEAVRSVPGVAAAAGTTLLPLSGEDEAYGILRADNGAVDAPDGAEGAARRYVVSPGYLETLGIRLLGGRTLGEGDDGGAPPVAVVSASLARRLFPGGSPLGRRIQFGPSRPDPYTVVGVVDDVKQTSLDATDTDAVYVTAHQWHWADRVRWLVVRTHGDPAALVPALRRAVWSVDADQPVVGARSMEAVVAGSEGRRRFVLTVVSAFAMAATALALVGLYGVLAGAVAERLPEMGVRAALGASRGRIVARVVGQGMGLALVGVGVGLGAAAAASAALATFLFRVSRTDPLTYGAVAGLLVAAAALACALPAARAARVDPAASLRSD